MTTSSSAATAASGAARPRSCATPGVPYVVLDFSSDATASAEEIGDLFIQGSGAEDEDLVRAGIDRARGILIASDDDGDNMYITLSAKSRRPDLTVIARASTEEAERKLRLAGADRVVTPYATAGRVMAQLMVKPQVASFLNSLTSSDQPGMSFEEIEVKSSCGAVGLTIGELDVAARRPARTSSRSASTAGRLEVRPTKDTLLEEADVIVGVGSPEEIRELERMFEPREVVA